MHGKVLAEDNVDGRFSDNDLHAGTRGTRIEAREQNDVYFEIANAIREARIPFDGNDESQLAKAMIAIAKREGALNTLELELFSSPQRFTLSQLGIPEGDYLATMSIQGSNPHDLTISHTIDGDNLTIYSWYTNDEGKRVQGVPSGRSDGGFGKSFGRSFGGRRFGLKTLVSIFLSARR
ncbi:hypothetical protein PVA45_07190 (plasmid) [Entomospira entomophila]|uniref:Uncharacterized protein n=1 Tax=Entomospira entomophila TaxID=2719988 RepID=A0A968KTE5_9SPIO|nr:hypothetical protein [Entomospira entomophilus]NIZ41357.1 hypothetical protein [Entomospira entomophilus]WDI36232.1 hypothetical protein PVA45_07190 [Entomospira entomophilus]